MTQPINLQVNVLAGTELPQRAQEQKNVEAHQQIGQEVDRAKESDAQVNQVQTERQAEDSELNKDGSGRGRGFLRRKRKKKGESDEEPPGEADPTRGGKVDFLR